MYVGRYVCMKRLGVFLLTRGWDVSLTQGYGMLGVALRWTGTPSKLRGIPTLLPTLCYRNRSDTQRAMIQLGLIDLTTFSPAVKGQNCSFLDKSIKLGRVTNLYKTNIS